MSVDSSNNVVAHSAEPLSRRPFVWSWSLLVLPLWVFVSFHIGEVVVELILEALQLMGISLANLNQSVLSALIAACIYGLTGLVVIGGPWLVRRYRTTRQDVALTRLPSWTDIFMAPAGLVVYFILSAILLVLAAHVIPGFNADQAQDTGFAHLNYQYEYILAFLTLVVLAPLAEEILFRGYLLGKLLKVAPLWLAILITSVLFGILHGSWNVGIDVFALSIVLCILRVSTGSIWAGVLLHMLKNGIAFYILFINPTLFSTLGR